MKRIFLTMVAAAGMLFVTSCAKDAAADIAPATGEKATVTFALNAADVIGTRADGYTLVYQLFDSEGKTLLAEEIDGVDYPYKSLSLSLIKEQTYTIAFWTSKSDAYTYKTADDEIDLTAVSVDYTTLEYNSTAADAFCAAEEILVTGDETKTIYLRRPLAQLNLGLDNADVEALKLVGDEVAATEVTFGGVATKFDVVTATASNEGEPVTFYAKGLPEGELKVNGKEYLLLSQCYLLPLSEKATIENTEYTVTLKNGNPITVSNGLQNVPVQANWRTNIVGRLLSSNISLEIELDENFGGDLSQDAIALADGVIYDEETFYISNANGLKWIAEQVNRKSTNEYVKTADNFQYGASQVAFVNQNIKLSGDIDLKGVEWTPIGNETKSNDASLNAFAGIFDGCGYTISNLTVSPGEKNNHAGLFGATNRATIKNLTLKNVAIEGHYKAGAVVADGQNARIEDVHIDGGYVKSTPWLKNGKYDDANNVGGIVGYLNGQPEKAYVKNSTVNNLEITAFRKVGGIAGVATTADDANPHTSSVDISGCKVSNTTITADMTNTEYDGFAGRVPDIDEIVGVLAGDRYTCSNNTHENVTLQVLKSIPAGDNDALAAAVATPGATVNVPSGTYTEFPSSSIGKDVTVVCEEGTVFEGKNSLSINGSTIIGATFKYYSGNASGEAAGMGNINGNFENCTFEGYNGTRWAYVAAQEIHFTSCKFSGTAIYALHIDSSVAGITNPYVYFDSCDFDGFLAISGKGVNYQFDDCIFNINSSCKYGGGNFYCHTIFNNCQFYLPVPKESFRYICLAQSGIVYEFNNCKNYEDAITADFDFNAVSGAIVKIDGGENVVL